MINERIGTTVLSYWSLTSSKNHILDILVNKIPMFSGNEKHVE